ncbi:peroxidase 12-like [Setaria italica]|uniref:peroxidase 12-like n=1 Tax=Setaria italica TaxID=4555 RepID=UPI0003513AEB|nr:peroxidase 12-like [Setaria italica]
MLQAPLVAHNSEFYYLRAACGRVVSYADIVTLAARDSVVLGGGPAYKVPLGRRDGLAPASEDAILGALSGGHTVGIAHCGSFEKRLFPTQDPTLNQWFAGQLRLTCPVEGATNTTVNDIRTPTPSTTSETSEIMAMTNEWVIEFKRTFNLVRLK